MALLLQIENIEKHYGPQVIFDQANLSVQSKKRIAVIGRNGAGKSTFFKLLLGQEEIDSGQVTIFSQTRLGYLEQHDPFSPGETIIDFLERYTGQAKWRCGKVAAQFQLKNELLDAPIDSLASGYRMRVKLTAMLLQEPNLLLLDEPTNYLDLSTQLLFEQFLKSFNGGYMIISHDREFLKNVTDHTLDIDRGQMFLYPRPLEEYFAFKEEQVSVQTKANVRVANKQKHLQKFVDRFGAKASKAAQAKSKQKQINKLEQIEIVHSASTVRIKIPAIETKKGLALTIKDLKIGYDGSKVIASDINLLINRGQKVAIVGDNGQGKSTFFRTLAGEIPAIGGEFSWSSGQKIAYFAQHIPAGLDPEEQAWNYLRRVAASDISSEEVHKMAANFLFADNDGKKLIKVLSGGERTRLCLAGLLLQKREILLLDEPSNHLDFETTEALARALRECNSTLLFVSHNRTFVNTVANSILEVNDGLITHLSCSYSEYVANLGEQVLDKPAPPKDTDGKPKLTNKQLRQQQKLAKQALIDRKRAVRNLEAEIASYETEKAELHRFFSDNPTEYSTEKAQRLTELSNLIEQTEAKWVKAQEQLETPSC